MNFESNEPVNHADASHLPDSPPPPSSPWPVEATFWLLMIYFASLGVLVGSTGVVWASLVDELQIDSGPFGTAQLVSALVSTVIVLAYARLSGWKGPRLIAAVGAAFVAISMLVMTGAGSLAVLVLALALMGLGTGLSDGAMTQGSVDWEQATRRRRMSLFHAGFSIGAVAGSLGTGGMLAVGLSFHTPLIVVAILHVGLLVLTAVIRFPPVESVPRTSRFSDFGDVLAIKAVRALVLIILLSIVVEVAVFIWGVIYIQTELDGSDVIGGISYGAFNAAMFTGRMLNAPIVARHGARFSLAASGAGLVVGGMLLIIAWSPAIGMVALVLTGLGVAGVYPTVMSSAGDRLPGRSGSLAAIIMTATYLAGMLTPPLMGWIAQFGSLRIAMAAVGLSGVGIFLLARVNGDQ